MRWRFIDPSNLPEAAERSAVIAKIDSWWREFESKADEIDALLSRQTEWDLPGWTQRHLQTIHPSLMWEYGPAVRGGGRRLVITPECDHHLRPLVRAILKRAPVLEGWEFYEYRLAEDVETSRMAVEWRTGREIADFKVRVSRGEEQRIELEYTAPSIADPEDESARGAAFAATETILGEECLNNWIGAVEIVPMPRAKGLKSLFGRDAQELPHFIGLDRLKETVDSLIGSMRDQLPKCPHCEWVEDADWMMYELKPERADDYFEQEDLLVGVSANPTQWTAARSGGLFCSRRFSRCGETFCYVKLDRSEGFGEDGYARRWAIEKALDAVLKPDKLGCQIGGGTGLRYSYIDLALTDVDKGIQATRERLQAESVPPRSWIQFCDSDLATEWVGVYDDSPLPPLALEP